MRKSRFTEEQIIGILKEQEAGRRRRTYAIGMDQRDNILQMEGEVRRS